MLYFADTNLPTPPNAKTLRPRGRPNQKSKVGRARKRTSRATKSEYPVRRPLQQLIKPLFHWRLTCQLLLFHNFDFNILELIVIFAINSRHVGPYTSHGIHLK